MVPKNCFECLQRKWCENLNMEVDNINTSSRICELHFEERCLLKKLLKHTILYKLNNTNI